VCVLGATGFTGKFVCAAVARACKQGLIASWAAAGRDRARLDAVVGGIAAAGLPPPSAVHQADVRDEGSLRQVATGARMLVNCAGPFRFLGEPVVRACVAERCHYVDITGEPEFMERVEVRWRCRSDARSEDGAGACPCTGCPWDHCLPPRLPSPPCVA